MPTPEAMQEGVDIARQLLHEADFLEMLRNFFGDRTDLHGDNVGAVVERNSVAVVQPNSLAAARDVLL
jgi:hypothetical protein